MAMKAIATLGVGTLLLATSTANAQSSGSFDGSAHVEFDVESSSANNVAINNQDCISSVNVSESNNSKLGGELDAAASIASFSLDSNTRASVSFGSSEDSSSSTNDEVTVSIGDTYLASTFMTKKGDTTQQVNVGIGPTISTKKNESDRKVLMRSDNNVEVAVLMRASSRSDGELRIVEDDGQVQAKMDPETKVIMRSYVDGRSEEDDDDTQEEYIKKGTTTADIDIAQDSNGSLRVASQPYYSDVSINGASTSSGSSSASATFTVDKSDDQGQHVICKLDNTFDSVTNVRVNGNAATKVNSYEDLDGDQAKFLVKSRSNGRNDLMVHFGSSTSGSSAGYRTASNSREVTVEGESSDDDNSSERLSATPFKLYALGSIAAVVLAAAPM